MQRVATALLGIMAILFAVAGVFELHYPVLGWVRAAAEAGLIGGLADWFAVVALFRHPLGLPFPHTAIIPRNKDRIGAALGGFIERRFLTPENVLDRLAGISLADRAARWLAHSGNATAVAGMATGLLPRLIEAIDDADMERLIARIARERFERLDAASLVAGTLRHLGAESRLRPVLDQLLDALGRWLDAHRATILARYGSHSRWTPKWADSYIVNRFVDAILDLMQEIVHAPRHDLREAFDRAIVTLADRLETEPGLRAQTESFQKDMAERLGIERLAGLAWADVKQRLISAEDSSVTAQLGAALKRLAQSMRRDPAMIARADAVIRSGIGLVVRRARPHVSGLINDVVARWDAREATRNLEDEVGRDLQFIRLNGTLVGALAGLGLYAIGQLWSAWGPLIGGVMW